MVIGISDAARIELELPRIEESNVRSTKGVKVTRFEDFIAIIAKDILTHWTKLLFMQICLHYFTEITENCIEER